jgi:hypothetical protein
MPYSPKWGQQERERERERERSFKEGVLEIPVGKFLITRPRKK